MEKSVRENLLSTSLAISDGRRTAILLLSICCFQLIFILYSRVVNTVVLASLIKNKKKTKTIGKFNSFRNKFYYPKIVYFKFFWRCWSKISLEKKSYAYLHWFISQLELPFRFDLLSTGSFWKHGWKILIHAFEELYSKFTFIFILIFISDLHYYYLTDGNWRRAFYAHFNTTTKKERFWLLDGSISSFAGHRLARRGWEFSAWLCDRQLSGWCWLLSRLIGCIQFGANTKREKVAQLLRQSYSNSWMPSKWKIKYFKNEACWEALHNIGWLIGAREKCLIWHDKTWDSQK